MAGYASASGLFCALDALPASRVCTACCSRYFAALFSLAAYKLTGAIDLSSKETLLRDGDAALFLLQLLIA